MLLVGTLVFFKVGALGQQQTKDELLKLIAQSKPDTNRVKLLLDIERYYNFTPSAKPAVIDSAMSFAEQAEKLSSTMQYAEGTGLSWLAIARAWCNKRDFKKCNDYTRKAIAVFTDHNLLGDAAAAYVDQDKFYTASGGQDLNVRIGYFEQALLLFHQAGAIQKEASALEELGDFYQMQEKYVKSLDILNRSLVLYKSVGYRHIQGIYDLLGMVSSRLGNFKDAVSYGMLALKTAEMVNDTTLQLCTFYNRIGLTFLHLSQYQQAEFYFKKSLNVAKKYNDTSSIVQVVLNNAHALLFLNKPSESLSLLKYYMHKYPDFYTEREYLYGMLINVYLALNQYNSAQIYCNKLIEIYKLTEDKPHPFTQAHIAVIKFFIATHQYPVARKYLSIYKKGVFADHDVPSILQAYLYEFKIDSTQGKYIPAMNAYQNYTNLKDSLFTANRSQQIEELKIQYETARKEKDIVLLKKDKQLAQNKEERVNSVLKLTLVGIGILILFMGLLYQSYRIKQRSNVEINKKNASLNQLVRDKEWLVKEIHHRVKNNLQIIMGLLQRQSSFIDNAEALTAIQNSEHRMRSIALIHQRLYQSDDLAVIDMPAYVEDLVAYLKDCFDTGSRINFLREIEDIQLDVAQAVPLGLILNEAITNSIKYAFPGNELGLISIILRQINENEYLL
ncbi:MAG TPA: histidine kinase dimerization/phosphoacceptor domain -containing protein, partial [Mucilaginibacter sp.]|nr:histidine kinase dimerization/phosphoacceptor domain -containing protein [Mucilaginibacter sp.]